MRAHEREDIDSHVDDLIDALRRFQDHGPRIERWGRRLAALLSRGGRLLTCGNGGSAAEAQHLSAELVGRYVTDRRPLAAMPLHADASSVTAIVNDYGSDQVYARQVHAHGRPGDVLMCLSTSGRSRNILTAAQAARECEISAWALTGPAPNALASLCDDAIQVQATRTATIQEVHLAAIHMLCAAVDRALTGGVAEKIAEKAERSP